ncbi:magnesium transporter CorA family protein [Candidatus Amarolinea dominans]|uniref:magnesium transporter CorA family protein n=1 Tax=Candidatus Amarolinea dominans TaxID=3140696 RepID=UPI001D8F723C|nr:magnesium transporter CorA family protein [Anaerolineae bacterium]
MITVYQIHPDSLEVVSSPTAGCWINVLEATQEDAAQLEAWGFPSHYVTYALDPGERARVEHSQGVTLIVFLIPHAKPAPIDTPYATLPLGILITESNIVTICCTRSHILRDIAAGKIPDMPTVNHRRFILKLLLRISEQYLKYLRTIDEAVEQVEVRLHHSLQNREVLELLKYQKCLVYFVTALRSNELMLKRLQKSALLTHAEDEELLEDVLIEIRQAIELTEISERILGQMMGAFTSIISNNLNVVMKFLAAVTIIISLPTLVASFFGMNVNLPAANHPLAFWFVIGLAGTLAISIVLFFWRKHWL